MGTWDYYIHLKCPSEVKHLFLTSLSFYNLLQANLSSAMKLYIFNFVLAATTALGAPLETLHQENATASLATVHLTFRGGPPEDPSWEIWVPLDGNFYELSKSSFDYFHVV